MDANGLYIYNRICNSGKNNIQKLKKKKKKQATQLLSITSEEILQTFAINKASFFIRAENIRSGRFISDTRN